MKSAVAWAEIEFAPCRSRTSRACFVQKSSRQNSISGLDYGWPERANTGFNQGLIMKNDPFIVAAFLKAGARDNWGGADGTRPMVTVSSQRGSAGGVIAKRVAEVLTERSRGHQPWIFVDRNIAGRVMEEHRVSRSVARYLSEEEVTSIEDHVVDLLGLNVAHSTALAKMTETIVRLARMGHVVFVGRAAHVIAAKFPRAVHVRVIGSFARRLERVMEETGCSSRDAATEIRRVDEARRDFVATNFHVDLEDTAKYDLWINTDRVSVEEAAQLVARLVSSPNFRDKEARKLTELRHEVLGV
jgi:cytidylate kinase